MTPTRAIVLAVSAAALACVVGVLAGSFGFGVASPDIMASIRVPRVLAGFGAGAALAVSGALMQLLTRNALADPYVLGVAGGAAVGALGAMLVAAATGLQLSEWGVAGGAAVGAAVCVGACCSACSGGAWPAPRRLRAAMAPRRSSSLAS